MPVDYFGRYFNDKAFNFSGLINDDFIQPVRVLYNAKHYVSATKLLLIAIDSIAFIEYGENEKDIFIKWLHMYADTSSLEIIPEELWEQRNALLHMSSLMSRKVRKGEVRQLVTYVGQMPKSVNLDKASTGYYELYALIKVFSAACGRWLHTYDEQREKIHSFVERYDFIASDARMLSIEIN